MNDFPPKPPVPEETPELFPKHPAEGSGPEESPVQGRVTLSPIQASALGVLFILLFIIVCRLFAPFFTVLLWSTLLYVLISPLHHRLIRNLDFSSIKGAILKNFWAAVFALGTAVLIMIPLIFIASLFSRQIVELMRYIRDLFTQRPDGLSDLFNSLSAFIADISQDQIRLSGADIERWLLESLSSGLQRLIALSSTVARNIGTFFVGVVLMVFTLFFFYTDGPYLSRLAIHAIPIRKVYMHTLVGKFMDITRNLFLGYILVALIQATLAYIIFTLFKVSGALVLAGLTFICVFIPMLGGGLVWLPLGLVRIITGDVFNGILFLIVSGFFISLLDNILRPMFLKDRIQLHPLIIFFAILGGVSVFGFNGLILGPMIVILFLTVLDMFLIEHRIDEG
ncbi:MAG: AI-2E family transporter [Treponema sp.]|jgi:predicted PurR-regulated permease PerM|nr:AI-2E family transporter [Treponema sp.]